MSKQYDQEKLIQLLGLIDWYSLERAGERPGSGVLIGLRTEALRQDILERLE